jgi:hypothetical protein
MRAIWGRKDEEKLTLLLASLLTQSPRNPVYFRPCTGDGAAQIFLADLQGLLRALAEL